MYYQELEDRKRLASLTLEVLGAIQEYTKNNGEDDTEPILPYSRKKLRITGRNRSYLLGAYADRRIEKFSGGLNVLHIEVQGRPIAPIEPEPGFILDCNKQNNGTVIVTTSNLRVHPSHANFEPPKINEALSPWEKRRKGLYTRDERRGSWRQVGGYVEYLGSRHLETIFSTAVDILKTIHPLEKEEEIKSGLTKSTKRRKKNSWNRH